MYEAEIKYIVHDVEAMGRFFGAKSERTEETYSDVYFVHQTLVPSGSDRELRVRQMSSASRTRTFLTFKDRVIDESTLSKRETEVEVVDGAAMASLLDDLGFERDIEFTKECVNWRFTASEHEILATMVRVPELDGVFLEIETLVDQPSGVAPALKLLRSLALEAGLRNEDETTATYTASVRRARG